PNLRTLSLAANQLESLPENFRNLTNLRNLSLYENPIANSQVERNKVTHLVPQGCRIIWTN
ncbi:MAG: leucine-rich repeat domain-containing protein, partial [Candidatus Hodarchaeota archaeon]